MPYLVIGKAAFPNPNDWVIFEQAGVKFWMPTYWMRREIDGLGTQISNAGHQLIILVIDQQSTQLNLLMDKLGAVLFHLVDSLETLDKEEVVYINGLPVIEVKAKAQMDATLMEVHAYIIKSNQRFVMYMVLAHPSVLEKEKDLLDNIKSSIQSI